MMVLHHGRAYEEVLGPLPKKAKVPRKQLRDGKAY